MKTASTRRTVIASVGAVSVAALAGCLGDDDDDEPADEPEETYEIEPETTIVLDGYATHWEGIEPSEMEGVENPTLVLTEGEEYGMEWINADNSPHNLEIRDDRDDVVDDLETEDVGQESERSETLEFTASEEMVEYICRYHQPQSGDLIVE